MPVPHMYNFPEDDYRDRPDPLGISLTVSQRNPLFRTILGECGILTERNGSLLLQKRTDLHIPRLNMDVLVENSPITRYNLTGQPLFLSDNLRFGLMLETHWVARDSGGYRI